MNERYRVHVSSESNDITTNANLTNTEGPTSSTATMNAEMENAESDVSKEQSGTKQVAESVGNGEGSSSTTT